MRRNQLFMAIRNALAYDRDRTALMLFGWGLAR